MRKLRKGYRGTRGLDQLGPAQSHPKSAGELLHDQQLRFINDDQDRKHGIGMRGAAIGANRYRNRPSMPKLPWDK